MKRIAWLVLIIVWGSCYSSMKAGESPENANRTAVVAYMRQMATITWTPEKDLTYWNPRYGVVFHAGTIFYGIPYTQRQRATNLEKFQSVLRNETGTPVYTGPVEYWGSDCSSAVSMAWQKADSSFPTMSTHTMTPGISPKIQAVGNYLIPVKNNTQEVVKQNGREKMFLAYDQLKPGDAVVTHRKGDGHVRLVSAVEPADRLIRVIEQTGVRNNGQLQGKSSSWRVDRKITYDELFNASYIPITLKYYSQNK